jgi:membrane-bound serine protease (ClpP class)
MFGTSNHSTARLVIRRLAMLATGSLAMLSQAQVSQPPPAISAPPPTAVPAYRQANRVAILTIEGIIDSVTLMSLERRMKKAVADGADAVVLDINTPGGEMFSTLEICALLRNRADTPANVVAWIHPTAYSAGTIIALACREIVVAPGSTLGDAAPIDMFGRQMNPTERAKFLSPLLTEIVDSARRNHYDEKLVQAFIMLDQELWMIENFTTGERIFVDPTSLPHRHRHRLTTPKNTVFWLKFDLRYRRVDKFVTPGYTVS